MTVNRPAARVELRALRWGTDLEAEAAVRGASVQLADGWVLGKPFRCLAVGEIYQRVTGSRHAAGEQRGEAITSEHLQSIVRAFEAGEEIPINREHNRALSQGTVVAMWLVDEGNSLAVLPAYNQRLAAYVAECNGGLWSSPEIAWDDTHDAATGERLGSMLMDGLALTGHPAQAHRKLDRVRLGADAPTNRATLAPNETEESKTMDEEMKAMLDQIMGRLDAQAAEIAALTERLAGEPEGESEDEGEGSGGSGDTDPTPPSDPQKDEMSAQVAALKAEVARMKQEKLAAEQAVAVRELLTSGRITPAEKKAAEKVVQTGGVELLSTVYGARKPGSAIPELKGHSQAVEPPEGEDGSKADKAIRAFLSTDEGKNHTYLSAAALIESKQPDLFI